MTGSARIWTLRAASDIPDTKDFSRLTLRSMPARALPRAYRRQSAVGEWLAFLGLRYASSITLFLEKRQTFRQK